MAKPMSIAVIQRQSPFTTGKGREALDMILALAAVEHTLSVFFCGDAVYQLLPLSNADNFPVKAYPRSFKLFALYDVEHLYVCKQSLAARQLSAEQLSLPVELVDQQQIRLLLSDQQHIIRC